MSIQLDKDFYACERGNTWLFQPDTGNHVAWFKLDDGRFLEVAVEPGNYPGFKVAVIEKLETDLAQHINEKCQSWLVRKCNVKGVNVEDDYVAGDSPCQHTPDEDCLTCCECGRCSESLDNNDVCAECREREAKKPQEHDQ